ncbi:MAG TPA: type II CRISPR RNA-guided endonuclease Cas9 [Thermoguttaceae bacterium]|nr:type II CRISPR RNA-guided endonuclease Cas9 [Thermoguttaceae bacterium]
MKSTSRSRSETHTYRLGIDLGSASIGWTAVAEDSEGEPAEILAMGIRRFEAGVDGSLDEIEAGKDKSRATARREARGPRRLTWRRQYRLRKLFRLLQRLDLLPPGDDSHDGRHHVLAELDRRIRDDRIDPNDHVENQLLPYRLRARALDEPLSRHEFGRALYHLAQRRGFLSNLKAAPKDNEDGGKVRTGITELEGYMRQAGSRTLGEYFASLDPDNLRIRQRWTARSMYTDEFNQIWAAQVARHNLTDEDRQRIHDVIFYQRPLKSQKHLIGRCDLEPGKRHAPLASLAFQEFRVRQRVNDLVVTAPDNTQSRLTPEQCNQLAAALDTEAKLTYVAIKKLLSMKKSREWGRHYVFNFEEAGDKEIIGNRTAAKLIEVLGDRWLAMSRDDRAAMVDEILAFESEELLVARLIKAWKLDQSTAKAVAAKSLEQGYGSLSRKAIARLMSLMEQGMQYATARKKLYADREVKCDPVDQLPANHHCAVLKNLRNPAVARALSELRIVVNALIRRYGKPATIRVELTRELKKSRKHRQDITDRIKKNTQSRDDATAKILAEMENGERFCTDRNKLKVQLAEECGWKCPFTGRPIPMQALVGDGPQFDIEHIIPFSRSLDNSFANKTLCYHEENRHGKKNRTPFEAYHGTDKWDEILQRVRGFNGSAARRKLELFTAETLPDADEFTNRQLTDTAYMSRLACDYLALLYGGQCDAEGRRRILVNPGRATAYIRQRWDLNAILGHPDKKERGDHRHHAIDALVVALTGPREVKMLSDAAQRAESLFDDRLFEKVDPPWEGFLEEAFEAVKQINVSSRVGRKLNGSLHKATIYSKPQTKFDENGAPVIQRDGTPATVHHVRRKIELLKAADLPDIVDPRIRAAVEAKLNGGDPAKVFKDRGNHPYTKTKDGHVIPIHKVRVRENVHPISVGAGVKARYVAPGSNHHMEIVAVLDKNGKEKTWEGRIVSAFDANQRFRDGLPIIQRNHGPDRRFKFSLAGGEYVEMEHQTGVRQLFRVVVISEGKIEFHLHSDARPTTLLKKTPGSRVTRSPGSLFKINARKVTVDPLGNILPAND